MANLKEIRSRISSVSSTRQITNAMKMVAAAKLRKAQDAITQLRPYADKLNEILFNVGSSVNLINNEYGEHREANNILIVLFTSNKGLCGSFNMNVIKQAIHMAENKYSKQLREEKIDFMAVGKKGYDYLRLKKYRVVAEENFLLDKPNFDHASTVVEMLMQRFVKKQYDRIFLVYNQFKNAGSQILTEEQFLPIIEEKKENKKTYEYDYIFEPDKEYIVQILIPKSLKLKFYRVLLDSNAAEHGARMTAMHQATDNASDLIRDLSLQYNKARQASITKEILEIVSGAEALKQD